MVVYLPVRAVLDHTYRTPPVIGIRLSESHLIHSRYEVALTTL